MNQKLKEKILESLSSVVPITLIVFALSATFVPLPIGMTVMFLVGASMLIVGMGFFTLGADIAMMPMGEGVGCQFGNTKSVWLVAFLSFLMGFIITIAEPDLQVLARQVPSIPNWVLIGTVAFGVGFFLVVAILRILYNVSLSRMLILFYCIVLVVSLFTPSNFVAVAFDSGGVTTGPITVPFIMALGIGYSSVRASSDSGDDSFGLVALCSIGPILAVLLLGICYNPTDATHTPYEVVEVLTTQDVARQFARQFPEYIKEVMMAVVPICIFFLGFQITCRRYTKLQLGRIAIGFVYTVVGLVLFLTGVNVGFIPVGQLLGSEIGASSYSWCLVPLGMLIGYYIVVAEPAVHVLNKQVEELSNGAISQKAMRLALSLGVAISLALAMIRILTGISIYYLVIPGYALALALSFHVPKIFIGIAFDSGGVASGPMTSTFLLPFAIGACEAVGGNVMTDAFGVVAMVAMTPLITIQLMGMIYARQMKPAAEIDIRDLSEADEIVDYEEDSSDE